MRLGDLDALKKAIDIIKQIGYGTENKPLFDYVELPDLIKIIDNAPSVAEVAVAEKPLDNRWIPITFRQANDDEYKEFLKRYDDIPREECKVYDCRLPDDGQEVLVTTCGGHVCEDIFCADPDYYGFENCSDPGDAIAWMPKPGAYKKDGDGE